MNTIRRARRRPRVDSMSFRTFFWLLRLEAAFMVYRAWYERASRDRLLRSSVDVGRAETYVGRSRRLLAAYESLRVL